MKEIQFTSTLSAGYREELEALIFFNPGQRRFRSDIVQAIARYGEPEIVDRNGSLHVAVTKCPQVQNLHAIARVGSRQRLAGTVIYFRPTLEDLIVVHIAVAPGVAAASVADDVPLAMQLLNEIVLLAKRVKGVKAVELPYTHGKRRRVLVAGDLPLTFPSVQH